MKGIFGAFLMLISLTLYGQTVEICNDGIDNDGDGLIDCEDGDCFLSNSQECVTCLGSVQSFADNVLSYNPVCPENHNPIVTDPQNAIGAPNYELPVFPAPFGNGFVSLGEGGSIELAFVDNILVNSGDSESDLYVFEVGTDIESMLVDLRPINTETKDILDANGYLDANDDGYYEIATIAGATSSLDLDALIPSQAFGVLKFDAIILTDVLNNPGCIGSSGADIDAVCALTSMAAEICDNGIDDDGDGQIDCDDPDLAEDCCCLMSATLNLGVDKIICPGESITITAEGSFNSYLWSNGSTASSITVSTEGEVSLEVVDDCENILTDTIFISFAEAIELSTIAEICDGETLEINNQVYDSEGIYQQILPGNDACDTTLTITITTAPPIELAEEAEICNGESIEINGEVYDSEGIYVQTLSGDNACDTTLTITIIGGVAFEATEAYTINSGESVEVYNEIYTDSGVYTQTLSSSIGCDSIITIIISVNQNIVHYDFEDCLSNSDGENTVYSEFEASYPDPLNCGDVEATNIYRENPTINGHSCTEGVEESIAMCVSSQSSCDYSADSELAIRFEVKLNTEAGSTVTLNQLSFYEKAPEFFAWLDGGSGPNNYPTLYGIRILSNDQIVFEEIDNATTLEWSLQTFDLSDVEISQTTSSTTLTIELIGYCTDGLVSNVTAWDIDEINLSATCAPITTNRTIAGKVSSTTGEIIDNVTVRRKEVEVSSFQNVDNNGRYAFESNINTDYTITAEKEDEKMKGVTTKDLILIQDHLLGFSEFTNAYQYIAADLNHSKHISSMDIVLLRKLILGVTAEYPDQKSWSFVKPNQNNENPWSISEQLDVAQGIDNSMENDLVAVKKGDVSGILEVESHGNTTNTRSENMIILNAIPIDRDGSIDQYSQIDFYGADMKDVYGFQVSINLNGIEVEEVKSKLINLSTSNFNISNDQLVISWNAKDAVTASDEEPLFSILGEVNPTKLNSLSLSSFDNEAYVGENLIEEKIILETRSDLNTISFDSRLLPNPMTNSSDLMMTSSKDMMSNIRIVDISGRLISQKNVLIKKGNNTITLYRSEFESTGLYCVLIDLGSTPIMHKLLVH